MTARAGDRGFDAPLGPGVRVLEAHPCGLFALEKPEGVRSHPNDPAPDPRALLHASYDGRDQCFSWVDAAGRARRVHLLHRLDAATSGVILVASDAALAETVRSCFEQRGVTKLYLAIVLGHLRERRALWRDAMAVRREDGGVRAVAAGRSGLEAEAAVRILRLIPGPPALSLLELEPRTGRTHQLRHQCARRGLPILGDRNYGDFKRNRELARRLGTDRLFLHALRVRLEFTTPSGATVRFAAEAPPPDAFDRLTGP